VGRISKSFYPVYGSPSRVFIIRSNIFSFVEFGIKLVVTTPGVRAVGDVVNALRAFSLRMKGWADGKQSSEQRY
jgi:hypothetical protein